jgi:protein dithiol:quinone oxidoreductase
MSITGRRMINLAGFAACAAMMGYALYAEHRLLLAPCPLCVFQRVAVIALGIVFLLAALLAPRGRGSKVLAGLIGVIAAIGAGVAGRHVWLQSLPPDEVPACGPGLDYILDSFPLSEALKLVFTGSGECATADWHFLGLSMPAWVLLCIAALGVLGVWNNARGLSVTPREAATPLSDDTSR